MPKPTTTAHRQAQRDAETRARQVPLPDGLDPSSVGATAALFVGQYRKRHRAVRPVRSAACRATPASRNTSSSTHRAHEHERETRTRARAVSRANPANHRGATRVAHARETAGFRGPCETHRESRETPVRNPAKLDAA